MKSLFKIIKEYRANKEKSKNQEEAQHEEFLQKRGDDEFVKKYKNKLLLLESGLMVEAIGWTNYRHFHYNGEISFWLSHIRVKYKGAVFNINVNDIKGVQCA